MPDPIAFLSSFTRVHADSDEELPWRLEAFWLEHEDRLWVAEHSAPELREQDDLVIIDRLMAVIRRSAVVIFVLVGQRRGDDETGDLVEVGDQISKVSHFEIEIFAAALHNKPIEIFIAKGFNAGPRLRWLLDRLETVIRPEQWRQGQSEAEILDGIRVVVTKYLQSRGRVNRWIAGLGPQRVARRLQSVWYRQHALRDQRPHGDRPVYFLNDVYEPRHDAPNLALVRRLLDDESTKGHADQRIGRLWTGVRELSVMPIEHATEAQLVLWDELLTRWRNVAGWYGIHGAFMLGMLAASYSNQRVRLVLERRVGPFEQSPAAMGGGIASALYSIAKQMPTSAERRDVLMDGHVHLERSFAAKGKLDLGLAHMFGSYELQLGEITEAIKYFDQGIALAERDNLNPGDR